MKSSLGIYVVLSTVMVMEASATTPSYLSYPNSQLSSQTGYYPHTQWNAGKQENNNQVQTSYNQPSQDWASGRNKNFKQYTNLSNAPKIYSPPALGSSNQLQLTSSTNYNPAVASSLLNPIPVVPSIPVNIPSDSQKFKIFPISLPPGANTIRLPISGVGSNVKVVHIGPQNEIHNNGVNTGISSDTLAALSRAESAIEKIESNSGAYDENKYIGGHLQPSQQSSSAISPSSDKLMSNSNYSGGPKYDLENNFQTTHGVLGIHNNDALATVGTAGSPTYQENKDNLYLGNNYQLINGHNVKVPTDGATSNSQTSVNTVTNFGYPSGFNGGSVSNYLPNYGNQGSSAYNNVKALGSPIASTNPSEGNIYDVNKYPQVYSNPYETPVQQGPSHNNGASTATPGYSGIQSGSNPGKYDYPQTYGLPVQQGTNYNNVDTTATASASSTKIGSNSVYGRHNNPGDYSKQGETIASPGTASQNVGNLQNGYNIPHTYGSPDNILNHKRADGLLSLSTPETQDGGYTNPGNHKPKIEGGLSVTPTKKTENPDTGTTLTTSSTTSQNSDGLHQIYNNPETYGKQGETIGFDGTGYGNPKITASPSTFGTPSGDYSHSGNNHPQIYRNQGAVTTAASNTATPNSSYLNHKYDLPDIYSKLGGSPPFEESGYNPPKDIAVLSDHGAQSNDYPNLVNNFPQIYVNQVETSPIKGTGNTYTHNTVAASNSAAQSNGNLQNKYDNPEIIEKPEGTLSFEQFSNGDPKDTAILAHPETQNTNNNNYHPENNYPTTHVNHETSPIFGADKIPAASSSQTGKVDKKYNKYNPEIMGNQDRTPGFEGRGYSNPKDTETTSNDGSQEYHHPQTYENNSVTSTPKTENTDDGAAASSTFTQNDGDSFSKYYYPHNYGKQTRIPGEDKTQNSKDSATLGTSGVKNDWKSTPSDFNSGKYYPQNIYQSQNVDPILGNDNDDKDATDISSSGTQNGDETLYGNKYPHISGEHRLPSIESDTGAQTLPNHGYSLVYPMYPDKIHPLSTEIDQPEKPFEIDGDNDKNSKFPASFYLTHEVSVNSNKNPSDSKDYNNAAYDGSGPDSDNNNYHAYPITSPQDNSQSSSTSSQDPDTNAHSNKLPIPTASNYPKHEKGLPQQIYKHPKNPDRKQSFGSSKPGHEIPIHGHGSPHNPTKDQQAFNYDVPSDSSKNGIIPSPLYQIKDGAANNPSDPNDDPDDGSALPQFPYSDNTDSKPYSTQYPLDNAQTLAFTPTPRYPASQDSDSDKPVDQLPIRKGFPLDYPWNPKYSLNPIHRYPTKSDDVPSHNPSKSTNYFLFEYPKYSDEAQPQNSPLDSSDDQGAEPFDINDDKDRQVPGSLYPTNNLADSNTVPKSPDTDSTYTKPHQTTLSHHPSDNSHATTSTVATSSSSSQNPSSNKPLYTVPIHRNPLIYPRHSKEKPSHSQYALDTAPDHHLNTQSKPNYSFTPTGNQSNKGVNHSSKQGKHPHKNFTKSPVNQEKPSTPSGSLSKKPLRPKQKKEPVGFFNRFSSYLYDSSKQKHANVHGDQADNASTGNTSGFAVIGNIWSYLKNLFWSL